MTQPLSISHFGHAVVRRAWLVLIVVAAVVVVAAVGVSKLPDRYSARVTLRIATAAALSGDVVRSDDSSYLERLQNTYAGLATSQPLRTALMRRMNLNERPKVSVSGRPASELMDVTVRTSDARSAAGTADVLASLLIEKIHELDVTNFSATESAAQIAMRALQTEISAARSDRDLLAKIPSPNEATKAQITELESQIALKTAALNEQQSNYQRLRSVQATRANILSVVSPATVPTRPSSRPGMTTVMGLSVLIGLAGGLSLIAVFERARTRVLYPDEVEHAAAGLRIIAHLSPPARRAAVEPPDSSAADGFRRVRTEVLLAADPTPLRSVMVTSPQGTTGAAWVASNLAVAFARAGHPCVVVDGAMTSPSLHSVFSVESQPGMADVLREDAAVEAVTAEVSAAGLRMIPAGDVSEGVGDALTPARVAKVIAALEGSFEVTIVHAPFMALDTDVMSFASVTSAVLLVVRSGETTRSRLAETCERLTHAGAAVLGIVLLDRKWGSGK